MPNFNPKFTFGSRSSRVDNDERQPLLLPPQISNGHIEQNVEPPAIETAEFKFLTEDWKHSLLIYANIHRYALIVLRSTNWGWSVIVFEGRLCWTLVWDLEVLEERIRLTNADDPYTLEQLRGNRLNKTVVRPLVDRFYDAKDISTGMYLFHAESIRGWWI